LLVGGGTPALLGTAQALWAPEPPVRLALLLAWSTRGALMGVAAAVLEPVRGPLILALLAVATLLVGRLVARLRAGRLRARQAVPQAAARAARRGEAVAAGRPAVTIGPDLEAGDPGAAVVVVGTVTGTIGRAWLGGRLWTVRGGAERLREGDLYVVLARRGDLLEVVTSS
jgi:hypothetical protein